MLKLIRLFFGYVIFTVTGPFPERFINLSAHYGICLWNIKRQKNTMTCSTMASEYKSLRKLARRSSMRMRLQEKKGLPFIIKKYKKRKGLLVGAICFFLIINFLSLYIWNIEINGNTTVSKNEIMATLSELRVANGNLKKKIDLANIEATLMAKYGNFAWISANINGCNLEIEIKEKVSPPELLAKNSPCNIKASCDAYVTRIEVYSGIAEVKPGDSVTAGQLLVNGIFEDNFGQNSIHHASAKIFAITNKTLTEEVDLCPKEHIYTGKNVNRKKIKIFNVEFPITFKPIPKGNFDESVEIRDLTFFEKSVPITLYTETWSQYTEETRKISKEEAVNIANKNMETKESTTLKDVNILKKDKKEKISNGRYILQINYSCEENIAVETPILFE